MSVKKWRFINPNSPTESITVHDPVSAQTLKAILQKDAAQNWIVEEDDLEPPRVATPPPMAPQNRNGERRSERRFPASFRIILVSGSTSFRTSSVDVSMSGMLLNQPVPSAFSGQKCLAYISGSDSRESIELICETVGDPKDLRRISFSNMDLPAIQRLEEWIREKQA